MPGTPRGWWTISSGREEFGKVTASLHLLVVGLPPPAEAVFLWANRKQRVDVKPSVPSLLLPALPPPPTKFYILESVLDFKIKQHPLLV